MTWRYFFSFSLYLFMLTSCLTSKFGFFLLGYLQFDTLFSFAFLSLSYLFIIIVYSDAKRIISLYHLSIHCRLSKWNFRWCLFSIMSWSGFGFTFRDFYVKSANELRKCYTDERGSAVNGMSACYCQISCLLQESFTTWISLLVCCLWSWT